MINPNGKISERINSQVESICMNDNQMLCLNKNNLKDWISPWDRSLPSPSISRSGSATLALGNDIYLFGGISEGQPNGVFEVEKFSTKHCRWSTDFTIKHEGNYLLLVQSDDIYLTKVKRFTWFIVNVTCQKPTVTINRLCGVRSVDQE